MTNPNRLPSGLMTGSVFIWVTIVIGSLSILKNLEDAIATIRPYSQSALPWSVAAACLGAILIVAVVSYLIHPLTAQADWEKLTGTAGDDPLNKEIERMAAARSVRRPRILIDGDILNLEAMAFGFPFMRRLALGRGYRLLLLKDPTQFEARLSHELAHIRNKDMDVAFLERGGVLGFFGLTVGCLAYFLVCLLQTKTMQTVPDADPSDVFAGTAYMAITCLLWPLVVWIAHKRFVRVREFLADAEAAAWTSVRAVTGALSGGALNRKWWSALLLSHPSPSARMLSVSRPAMAGYPSPLTLLGIGYLYGAFTNLGATMLEAAGSSSGNIAIEYSTADVLRQTILNVFNQPDLAFVWIVFLPLSAFAIPALLMLCLRQVSQGVALGRSLGLILVRAGLSATGFGIGVAIGLWLSPSRVALLATGARTSRLPVDHLPLNWSMIGPNLAIAAVFSGAALLLLLVATPLAFAVVRGRRKSRIRSVEWILLLVLTIYVVSGFGFAAIVNSLPRGPSEVSPVDMQAVFELYVPILIFTLGLLATMRPRLPLRRNGLAPWVTAK
jgi:hypothetical protein